MNISEDVWSELSYDEKWYKLLELKEHIVLQFPIFNRYIGFAINKRLRTTYGRAILSNDYILQIEISDIAIKCFSWDEIQDVVRHEFAHIKDFIERGTSAHDDYWKTNAILLGARPETYRNVTISPNFIKTYKYSNFCTTCTKIVSGSSRKWKSNSIYLHNTCNKRLLQILN